MPTASDSIFFEGITPAPQRDFIADQMAGKARIVLPCVGRWAVATCCAERYGADRIEASDLSLFSSLIGYLCDDRHSVHDLGVVVPPDYAPLVDGAGDDAEWTAGLLMCIKLLTLTHKHVHALELRRELWTRRYAYRTQVAAGLREQALALTGVTYDIRDVRDVVGELVELEDDDTGCHVSLPAYKGGYTRMYAAAEDQLWPASTRLAVSEFFPDESPALLDSVSASRAQVTALIMHGDEYQPPSWTKLAAFDFGKGRVDYVIANRDTGARLTASQFDKAPRQFPVWTDDDIIGPDTRIDFVTVDRYTALHYRDLFVHRLGQTQSEDYGLFLLDGKVVTAFGLHAQALRTGKSPFLFESFGISVSCNRYAHLGKLFILLLTSSDFCNWLMASSHGYQSRPPEGIRSSSPESATPTNNRYRGVMKLVSREAKPEGGYHLVYEAAFRDERWDATLARWLDKWGKPRSGWKPASLVQSAHSPAG